MQRTIALLLWSLLSCSPCFAAVALDSSGTNNNQVNPGTTVSVTGVTVGVGANEVLVAILDLCSQGVTGLTLAWDPTGANQALTEVGSSPLNTGAASGQVRVFRLVAPTAGNKTLTASWTGSTNGILGLASFSGVHQTTPIVVADTVTATGNSTSPSSGAVTSTTTGATFAATVIFSNAYNSTDSGTELFRNNVPSCISGAASYTIGGTSNTHGWTSAGIAQWAVIGIHLQAVAAASKLFRPAGDLTGLGVGGPFFKGVE